MIVGICASDAFMIPLDPEMDDEVTYEAIANMYEMIIKIESYYEFEADE